MILRPAVTNKEDFVLMSFIFIDFGFYGSRSCPALYAACRLLGVAHVSEVQTKSNTLVCKMHLLFYMYDIHE